MNTEESKFLWRVHNLIDGFDKYYDKASAKKAVTKCFLELKGTNYGRIIENRKESGEEPEQVQALPRPRNTGEEQAQEAKEAPETSSKR